MGSAEFGLIASTPAKDESSLPGGAISVLSRHDAPTLPSEHDRFRPARPCGDAQFWVPAKLVTETAATMKAIPRPNASTKSEATYLFFMLWNPPALNITSPVMTHIGSSAFV